MSSMAIIGAGPTGALLAIFLRQRGLDVTVYESRQDPTSGSGESGRSINLALADRGIHALKLAGVFDHVAATLVPMRGRLIHQPGGGESLALYGQQPSEVIYSISRHLLNRVLLGVARDRYGVEVRFEHRIEAADFEQRTLELHDVRAQRTYTLPMDHVLATDGAGSVLRRHMQAAGLIDVVEADLEHGYKELSIPADARGGYRLAHDVLHVWPRGNFMLIALPNTDGSFTATLFLAKQGRVSFASLASPAAVAEFFAANFADVYGSMPDCSTEFQRHPTGSLGTVYATPWHVEDMATLVGDSAHAIVPFHGQGMNCCFEDCVEFARCVDRNSAGWRSVFAEFYAARKPNADAIAAMALENYLEMRERVIDPKFQLQQALALELERRHPRRFIPRYSMVMFHHEIDYRTALERGSIQTQLLAELTDRATTLADVDYSRAAHEIELKLPPLEAASAPG